MKGVVKGMDKGLASMDVDKISSTMDKFEQQFEDLDVKAAYMDTAMNATTANATPVDQVDQLVMMVADENVVPFFVICHWSVGMAREY